LKPARANSSQDPISKIPNTKRAGGVANGRVSRVQTPIPSPLPKEKKEKEN
jgi:hypothetical protein